jgi:hypothetical protein
MTTPEAILQDLMSGQSTADSIAGRLRVPTLTIEAMLQRHELAGLVESGEIHRTLTVWYLTAEGRQGRQPVKPFPKAPASA